MIIKKLWAFWHGLCNLVWPAEPDVLPDINAALVNDILSQMIRTADRNNNGLRANELRRVQARFCAEMIRP